MWNSIWNSVSHPDILVIITEFILFSQINFRLTPRLKMLLFSCIPVLTGTQATVPVLHLVHCLFLSSARNRLLLSPLVKDLQIVSQLLGLICADRGVSFENHL